MSDQPIPRRLNFGCGYDKREGYLNVDSDPACEPDVLLVDNDLSVLPRHGFDEILAHDVLEHIPRAVTPAILLEWADLLTDGGKLVLQTSSIEGVASQLADNPSFRDQHGWTICLFGNQAHPGDFHLTGFTDMTLSVHLLAAGFRVDSMWVTDHWLLHAEATKVADWTDVVEQHATSDDEEFLAAAYRAMLDRESDDSGRVHFTNALAEGRASRRDVVKELGSSPEHLFVVAAANGFEGERRPGIAARLSPYVPDSLRPYARRAAERAVDWRAAVRRTFGSLRRREPVS